VTLDELEAVDCPALILVAARVGATRLIDNTIVIRKGIPIPKNLLDLIEGDAAALPVLPRDT
jgi:hypothetical protein